MINAAGMAGGVTVNSPGTPGRRPAALNTPRPDSPILKERERIAVNGDTKKLRPLSLGTNVNRWRDELEELKRL